MRSLLAEALCDIYCTGSNARLISGEIAAVLAGRSRVYDYLGNIYSTILFKDVLAGHHIRNAHFLERLTQHLAADTGSLISAKKISDYLKNQNIRLSLPLVLSYLSYLTAAFFVSKVSRAETGGKKVFEIGEKYYFEDLGLRHAIIGFHEKDINKILENLVFLYLRLSGFKVTVGRTSQKEIDFVAERNEEKMYVQVACSLDAPGVNFNRL